MSVMGVFDSTPLVIFLIPMTVNFDSSHGASPKLTYRLDFADVAQCFHLSRVRCATFLTVMDFNVRKAQESC